MSRVVERCVDGEMMLASGTAWRAESSNPETQMASKAGTAAVGGVDPVVEEDETEVVVTWEAILAERAEWADMAISGLRGVVVVVVVDDVVEFDDEQW